LELASAQNPARSPARGSTLLRCPSPAGSCSARRVALYWLPALPPRRFDDLGVFLVRPWSRDVSPAIFPLGVGSSPECCEPRLRPPVRSPDQPLQGGTGPFRDHAGLPLVRFLLPRTQLRRVPLFRHELPCGRPCGTRIARPSSVPSSGFLPLSTVPASTRLARGLLDPAVRRGPRRFAVLFHTARVRGAPLQSFPFPGSRARSRRPLLPCGFVLRLPPAQCLQVLHGRFRRSRQLFATRAHPKADPGLMSQDDGSLRSLVRSPRRTEVCRTYRPVPTDTGLAGKRPARPLRSFAPPGSPFSDDPNTWPG